MAQHKMGIVQAPDDRDGNEQFYIVQFDGSLRSTQSGYLKESKGPLRESVIRDFFQKFGRPAHEVEEMFRTARATYRP